MYGSKEMKSLMATSDDNGRFEIGVQVVASHFTFIMTFFSYDKVCLENDYQITKSFGKVYSPTVELVVDFPEPVMLSQKSPPHAIKIDYSRQ